MLKMSENNSLNENLDTVSDTSHRQSIENNYSDNELESSTESDTKSLHSHSCSCTSCTNSVSDCENKISNLTPTQTNFKEFHIDDDFDRISRGRKSICSTCCKLKHEKLFAKDKKKLSTVIFLVL